MSKHIFWIASYPKSGNTLVRSILSSLFFSDTGIFNFDLLKKIVSFEELSRLTKCYNTRAENINTKNWKEKNILIFQNLKEIQKKINLDFSEDFAFFKTHFNGKNFDGQNFFVEEYLRGLIYIYRDPRDVCISWARHSNISKDDSLKFMLNENASINWIDQENFSAYKKKEAINKLIDFFEKNFKIKVINKDIKINNILSSTSFNNLQKLENLHGFNESIKENKFFAVGQKNQWKSELEQNQIKIIEHEFGLIMKKLKYKVHN